MAYEAMHEPARLGEVLARLKANRGWLIALGVALALLGVLALVQAVFTTLVSMVVLGLMMIAGGVLSIIAAFRAKGWGPMLVWLAGGVIYLLAGASIIANPLLGSSGMTLIFAALVLVSGAARIWAGVKARPDPGWFWLALSGVIAVLLALVVFTGWPMNSLWLIGMIIGIELISQGISCIALGIALGRRT